MSPILRADDRAGVVYTPPAVAGPMVRCALAPLVRGRTAAELAALRICDPAIGEGAFLVEARAVLVEAMRDAGMRADRALAAATRCLVGCDIDARAVATARAALRAPRPALRIADALELDWRAAFPDVFARGGFDAVIGNPPYIRQERLRTHKAALQGFASYDGVADLYVYFVELAHRLLRPDGRFCLITPNKWLTAAYARPLRRLLADAAIVEGVVDFARAPLFADADAFPCIVWGGAHRQRAAIRAARATTDDVAAALAATTPHPRARWRDDPWHIDAPADRVRIARLESRWPRLDEVLPARPSRGVVTGCNRAFVVDRATRDRLVAADPDAAPLIRPFLKGRDVGRWQVAPPERWILLVDRGTRIDRYPAIADHLARFRDALAPRPVDHAGAWSGRKPGAYRWYELQDPVGALAASRAPRLVLQDIQTHPACALVDGDWVPDTTVWILPTADRYLLAVLNSSLYGWYARRRFPPALNGAVRPKLAYLRALPIATPGARARRAIEELVDRRLAIADAATPAARALDAALDAAIAGVYEGDA